MARRPSSVGLPRLARRTSSQPHAMAAFFFAPRMDGDGDTRASPRTFARRYGWMRLRTEGWVGWLLDGWMEGGRGAGWVHARTHAHSRTHAHARDRREGTAVLGSLAQREQNGEQRAVNTSGRRLVSRCTERGRVGLFFSLVPLPFLSPNHLLC